jgi:hypothetical protein
MDVIIDISDDSNNITNEELQIITVNNQLSMTIIEMSFSLSNYVLFKNIFDKYIDPINDANCFIKVDLPTFLKLKEKIILFKKCHNLTNSIYPLTFDIYSIIGEIEPIGCEGNGYFDYIVNKLKKF